MKRTKQLRIARPGEFLANQAKARQITLEDLAIVTDLSASELIGIANGEREISSEAAQRLSLFFGNAAELWLRIQSSYDLRLAILNDDLGTKPFPLPKIATT